MRFLLLIFLVLVAVLLVDSRPYRKSNKVHEEMIHGEEKATQHQHVDSSKTHWPDLVGKNVEEVMSAIKAERPDLKIYKLSKNAIVTMEFNTERLRLYVDENNIVVRPPSVG